MNINFRISIPHKYGESYSVNIIIGTGGKMKGCRNILLIWIWTYMKTNNMKAINIYSICLIAKLINCIFSMLCNITERMSEWYFYFIDWYFPVVYQYNISIWDILSNLQDCRIVNILFYTGNIKIIDQKLIINESGSKTHREFENWLVHFGK